MTDTSGRTIRIESALDTERPPTAPGTPPNVVLRWLAETTAEITTQLAELYELATKIDDDQISNHLRCLGCLIEQHQGTRTDANPAAAIVGGQSTCLEHLQFADGPVIPGRTASGLILGNGS